MAYQKASDERLMEARDARRGKAEDRYLNRLEKRERAAEQMIGELCRDGETVYYVYPVGGRYREDTESNLAAFLIRNNYV